MHSTFHAQSPMHFGRQTYLHCHCVRHCHSHSATKAQCTQGSGCNPVLYVLVICLEPWRVLRCHPVRFFNFHVCVFPSCHHLSGLFLTFSQVGDHWQARRLTARSAVLIQNPVNPLQDWLIELDQSKMYLYAFIIWQIIRVT